tara:strand:+ start:385 stop:1404 length:1020 start_codon:yes stop_codon:yes gene_type:complete
MAEYKGIRGNKIKSLASDPTVNLGQTWYNTTSGTLKFDSVGAGAWATGTSLPQGRQMSAGLGTSPSAAIVAFGENPSLTKLITTLSWNGSTWTELNDGIYARNLLAGIGSTTAGLAVGGASPPNRPLVEEWDGTSWSEENDLNTGGQSCMGCGTSTAGLIAGGGGRLKATETYNGTSWTTKNSLNTNHEGGAIGFAGTTTATAVATGDPGAWGPAGPGTYTPNVEVWDGTSWTESGNMSIGRSGVGGTGISTNLIIYGGITKTPAHAYVVSNLTEVFDGTSCAAAGTLASARQMFARSHGTGTAALALAGASQPAPHTVSAGVQVWDGAPAGVKTVTVS